MKRSLFKTKVKKLIKYLSNAFQRRLNPTTRLMVEVGYLNENLERTRDGIHTFINFLESKYEKDFIVYLKERRAELEKEKEDCGD